MKRKYLSALLMGVLTLSSVSTFTSCKDYDDDINSLQEQVNKAALSSDVEALRTQVNNAATSAQNAATKAEEALTKAGANATDIAKVKDLAAKNGTDVAKALTDAANAATAASNAATAASNAATAATAAQDSANAALTKIAGLDRDLKNLALNAQSHVTATQLKTSLDSLAQVINEATSDSIANLTKIVNGYKGGINALYTAVTEVSLMGSWDFSHNSAWNGQCNLWFQTGTIGANYTFGDKEKDDEEVEHSADPKKSYVKDASINFPSEFLVRINPVNAKITPDMIKLIDSKGNDLDKLVKVVDVEKYDKLLTRASETGLWTVKVQLQDGVKLDRGGLRANGQNILYAVAVNNTASQAETVADAANRYVVSTYDLTVQGAYNYVGATDLGDVKVKAKSKDWKTVSSIKPNTSATGVSELVYAANGEDILVSFENLPNVDRFYVVRDDKHADESGSSELNAWKSYGYKGLNQVVAVKHGLGVDTLNIKINGQVGDEVQFRIFAVNYDGTLVEQNGRPFRVYVGAQSTTTSVAGNLVATGKETMETGWLPISGSLKNGGSLPPFVWVTVNNVNIKAYVQYAKDKDGNSATENSKIKFAKFSVAPGDLTKWADGATATGTIKDGENVTVNTIAVSLTKVMPTAETTKDLMKYSWKDNQLNNNVYTAYLYPAGNAWTTANALTGYKDMNMAINGLKPNFVISIANADLQSENGKNYYKKALEVTGTPWKVEVNNAKDDAGVALIDNETKHETTIAYNYGKISSVTPNKDYVIPVQTVQTVFACPLAKTAQTYDWTKHLKTAATATTPAVYEDVNVLTYGSVKTVIPNIFNCLVAHNSFDNTVFGGALSDAKVYGKYVNIDAKLISNGSQLEDYYTATVTNGQIRFFKQSAATNPTADVESTLVLTMTDAFGHKNIYELPFKVKRAE